MEDLIVPMLVAGVVCGIACALIADVRGAHSGGWFVLGFLFSFAALLFVSIVPLNREKLGEEGIQKGTHKKCDYCAEVVKAEAVKCRYCASPLEVRPKEVEEDNSDRWIMLISNNT